jgi:hypothetical protein
MDRFERNFGVAFFVILLLNLAWIGVLIWAVIELVQWITSK